MPRLLRAALLMLAACGDWYTAPINPDEPVDISLPPPETDDVVPIGGPNDPRNPIFLPRLTDRLLLRAQGPPGVGRPGVGLPGASPPGHSNPVTVRQIRVTSEELLPHASTLAVQLERLTGRTWPVEAGAVPEVGDLYLTVDEADHAPDYEIQPLGRHVRMRVRARFADRAVWVLLHELGYRHFMPGAHWEHLPRVDEVVISQPIRKEQDYLGFGALGTGGGLWPPQRDLVESWRRHNGIEPVAGTPSGHAWQAIARAWPDEITAPFHRSTVGNKLNATSEVVLDKAVEWAKRRVDATGDRIVSMTASDGGGWDEPEANPTGLSPSDRQALIANHVQEALLADPDYDDVRVTMLAYASTNHAPTVPVHPRIVIPVTDGFYQGNTWDGVIAGYREAGATDFVPYLYWSVFVWSFDEPGRSMLNRLHRFDRALGLIRGMDRFAGDWVTGSASPAWGPDGLGLFALAAAFRAEQLPDDGEAWFEQHVEELITAMFPNTAVPVTRYFDQLLHRGLQPWLAPPLVTALYEALLEAWDTPEATEAERERITELMLYARAVDLRHRILQHPLDSAEAVDAFEHHIEWAWQIRHTPVQHYRSVINHQPTRQRHLMEALEQKFGMAFTVNNLESSPPWLPRDLSPPAVRELIARSLAEVDPMPFEPVPWSTDPQDLVPALPEGHVDLRRRGGFQFYRPDRAPDGSFYIRTREDQTHISVRILGGPEASPGDITVSLVDLTSPFEVIDASWSVPTDMEERTYSSPVQPDTLYRVDLSNPGGEYLRITPDDTHPDGIFWLTYVPVVGHGDFAPRPSGRIYFWVPEGTEVIGGFWSRADTRLIDPEGRVVIDSDHHGPHSYFAHHVLDPALTGRIWAMDRVQGPTYLYTVPPMWAHHPNELLVPAEALAP